MDLAEGAPVTERIKVDRVWIGPPRGGTLRNPTAWLFVAAIGLLAVGTYGYLDGVLSAAVVLPLHALAIYLSFTVLHDGMHGVAHEVKWVNEALASVAGVLFMVTLPLFRGVHYEHHSHTNEPGRDPDLIVARRPHLLLPIWSLGVLVEYRRAFYGRSLWRRPRDRIEATVLDLGMLAVVVVALLAGWWEPLFVLWVGPVVLAVLWLAFAFDFLPHYPYDTATRYYDTRVCPGRVLNAIFLGQNYHLIHHLWTTIPWYRYQGVFDQIAAELAARHCRIGWRTTPLPDGTPRLSLN